MSSQTNVDAINVLKRRCEALEEQLATANAPKPKNISHAEIYAGRPIRRLVSFFDSARDLVDENDRRLMIQLELESVGAETGGEEEHHTLEQERLFRGYNELLLYVPSVKENIESGGDGLAQFFKNIGKGSDMARGDDTSSLKFATVEWIHEVFGVNTQRLETKHKVGRGLDHDHCGKLLCPVEFDWSDMSVRAKIRDGDPTFAITAYSWPHFVYAGFEANANDMEKGLFRSTLLLKAYKHIFTSPTSVTENEAGIDAGPAAKRRKTVNQAVGKKTNVANLIHMNQVTPRSIAYIAVQVRFALSSLSSWNEVDIDFNHRDFYNAIVDYFEVTPGPVARRNAAELLQWWNKLCVFRRRNRQTTMADAAPNSSVTRLATQRAAKEVEVEVEVDELEELYA